MDELIKDIAKILNRISYKRLDKILQQYAIPSLDDLPGWLDRDDDMLGIDKVDLLKDLSRETGCSLILLSRLQEVH